MRRLMWTIITMTSILICSTIIAHDVYAQSSANPTPSSKAVAIPDWVKTQFEWFVDGQIDEATLLTSMNWMFDNNLMHLSEKAAQEVNDLREVNKRLHYGISTYIQEGQIDENEFEDLTGVDVEPEAAAIAIPNLLDARKSGNEATSAPAGDFVSVAQGDINNLTTDQALQHLRKAYDLNPNDVTVIAEFDPDHDKWVIVRAFEWHTQTTQDGEILSPSSIQKETFVFSHLLENSAATSSDESTDQTTVTFTGLESASSAVQEIMLKGGTTSAWQDGIASFPKTSTIDSVVDELQGIVVLCSTEIDKQSQIIDSELEILDQWLKIIEKENAPTSTDTSASLTTGETSTTGQYNQSDLDFIQTRLASIDLKIKSLSTGVEVLEGELASVGEDSQLANMDLQNALQKQQQILQTLSSISKSHHDTLKSIINNMR